MFSTVDMPCHLKKELRFWWRGVREWAFGIAARESLWSVGRRLAWNLTENYKTRCGWVQLVTQMVKEGQLVDAEGVCVCACECAQAPWFRLYLGHLVQPRAVFSVYFVFLVEEMVHRLLTGNVHHAQIIALCVCACLGVLAYKHIMCTRVYMVCICSMYVWSITKYICKSIIVGLTALLFHCLFPSLTSTSKLYFLYYR